jgi:hypothetical protein
LTSAGAFRSITPALLQGATSSGMTIMQLHNHSLLQRKHGFKPATFKRTLRTSSRAKAERKAG